MNRFRDYSYQNFRLGAIITAALGIILVGVSILISRIEFFLLLNTDLGKLADHFFSYCTHLGDGTVWIPVGVLVIIYRKKKFLLVLSTVAIGTLIVQSLKNFIIPAQLRPATAIGNPSLYHSVEGVQLLTNYSFPSGHTTTAFSIFLLGCLLINKKWVLPVGLLYGLAVGYSRIYLAEHFPIDVGGGMLAALVSVWLSILLQAAWDKNRHKGYHPQE